MGSSKNLLMDTSWLRPFRLRVFIMNSLARCVAGWGSNGRIIILLSNGSPGTICQWWKTDKQNACPCVCVRRSVSKPNESMAGMKAFIVYNGEPGTGASCVTCPLKKSIVFNCLYDVYFHVSTFFSPIRCKRQKRNRPVLELRRTGTVPLIEALPSEMLNIRPFSLSE